jgi:hypothetical protein
VKIYILKSGKYSKLIPAVLACQHLAHPWLVGLHPAILSRPIWFAYIRPTLVEPKRDFVESFPIIDVDSIAKDYMRCTHCWCNVDEEDEDGQKDSPVHAPCPFGHGYDKSCLLELMLYMGQEMPCPLC